MAQIDESPDFENPIYERGLNNFKRGCSLQAHMKGQYSSLFLLKGCLEATEPELPCQLLAYYNLL